MLPGETLRTLVTFILRLWVDPQEAHSPAWEGQVECVADGAHAHVRSQEELLRFIETQTAANYEALNIKGRDENVQQSF